ncbi:MAG: hypothetical protein M5U26_00615 [Planctomycetota bacterium]|nr:hypothetical protein [Planctomycetota bacterium]
MGRKRIHPQKKKNVLAGMADTPGSRSLSNLASNPQMLFQALAEKLGGVAALGKFLGCSRATAYNLVAGRKRWSAEYLSKALGAMGDNPVVNVEATAHGGYDLDEKTYRYIKPQALVLDCDGAFQVKGNAMWPLVGHDQFVLYRNAKAEDLQPGDVVLVRSQGETLVRAWHPNEERKGEVFLGALYRGPREYRKDLFQSHKIKDLSEVRKVVGVWMG